MVVRPEHARIDRDAGALSGTLGNIVYFGTDTHYHIRLDIGGSFVVRQQNARGSGERLQSADRVAVVIGDDAVQVLRD